MRKPLDFSWMIHRCTILALAWFVTSLAPMAAHANLEEFVCPDGYECPEEIMPRVELWTKVYGEYTSNQVLIYNSITGVIYDVIDCGETCNIMGKYREKQIQAQQPTEDIKFRTGLKDKITAGMPMYKKYRNYIVTSLNKAGLPAEIQYLPFSESSYDPFAESTANPPAVGTWQLMPSAARRYGLVVDKKTRTLLPTIDERRDPIKSTDAAMKYFKEAENCLNGASCDATGDDFTTNAIGPFLMTSYIYGIKGMSDAIRAMGSTNFVHIRNNYNDDQNFGPYSRDYYAKFLAVVHVVKNEGAYFGEEIQPTREISTLILQLRQAYKVGSLASVSYSVNDLKYLPDNMKYTDYVWNNRLPIPSESTIELPYAENSPLPKNTEIIDTRMVQRETLDRIEPRRVTVQPSISEKKPVSLNQRSKTSSQKRPLLKIFSR